MVPGQSYHWSCLTSSIAELQVNRERECCVVKIAVDDYEDILDNIQRMMMRISIVDLGRTIMEQTKLRCAHETSAEKCRWTTIRYRQYNVVDTS